MREREDLLAESNGIQENRKQQDKGTAKPILPKTRRQMSCLVEPFSIMEMLEQMVETRSWKAAKGLVQDRHCRVCHKRDEAIQRLVSGYKVLANSEYLSRQNRPLMVMAITSAKEYELVGGDVVWYKERWE